MRLSSRPPVLEIPSSELRQGAFVFRAVNHVLRMNMLQLLHKNGKMNVGQIYDALQLPQSIASQQLGILRRAAIVKSKKQGKAVYYEVNYEQLEKIQKAALQLVPG